MVKATPPVGTPPPTEPRRPEQPPPPGVGRNRNMCPECHTLLKAMDGQRACVCSQVLIGNKIAVNKEDSRAMCFTTATGSRLAEVAYIRGAQSRQTTEGLLPATLLNSMVEVARQTETALSPVTSDTESAPSDHVESLADSSDTESIGEQFEDGVQFEDFNNFRAMLKVQGKKGAKKTSTPLENSEEEGTQREREVEERKRKEREENDTQLAHGAEERALGAEEGEENCDHAIEPPEEPDQGHSEEGEAIPRAGAPNQDEGEQGTSPMHTRAGTYLDKPARKKLKKVSS